MNPLLLSSLPTRHPGDVGNSLRGLASVLIARLAYDPRRRGGDSCQIRVQWTPFGSSAREVVRVISWADEPIESLEAAEGHPNGVNRDDLTGLAAVIACALLIHDLDGIVLHRVAIYGDRGDYHLQGGAGMVEVSGIRSGTDSVLRSRVREKADQLFENAAIGYGVVSVTMFEDPNGTAVSVLRHFTRRDWEDSP